MRRAGRLISKRLRTRACHAVKQKTAIKSLP